MFSIKKIYFIFILNFNLATCNIPTTTLLTFYYSETGSEINPQKYIVYAEKSFSKTTYI